MAGGRRVGACYTPAAARRHHLSSLLHSYRPPALHRRTHATPDHPLHTLVEARTNMTRAPLATVSEADATAEAPATSKAQLVGAPGER